MTFQDEIKIYIERNKISIDKSEYMLRFFEDNISERYTIFSYTENLNIETLKYKIKNALKIINLNLPLSNFYCDNWIHFFQLIEEILDNKSLSPWSKEKFQIDFITLTLEAIIYYQKQLRENK